ncbi:MAG: WD40 repeat domain-containing protein [Cyanobacteria bacterium P01_E01_bin.42]
MKIFLFLSIFFFSSWSADQLFFDCVNAAELTETTSEEVIESNLEDESLSFKENPIIKQWRNVGISNTLAGHNAPIMSLAFGPDGQILASGGSETDGSIYVWDTNSGRRIRRNRIQNGRVTSIAIASEGNIIASSSDVAGVSLWEWQNRRRRENERWVLGHQHNILAMVVTPDDRVLITGGLDGIRVLDLRVTKPLYTLVRFDVVTALAIHPNGYILASASQDGTLKFWNLRTSKLVKEFEAHEEAIDTLAFTPDGETLISGSRDRSIKLWRSETGELLKTLDSARTVNAIAVHPSGVLFASGSREGIRLWDIETGEIINLFTDYSDWVETLAFSPDGNILATGGFDNQVKLWRPISRGFSEDNE